ncbi:acyltransferase family protein [Sphingomonas sp. M1A8_2b]
MQMTDVPGTIARRERDVAADILRGLAIVLVVYGHHARGVMKTLDDHSRWMTVLKAIDFTLYTTHMPVFFLVAGYNAFFSIRKVEPGRYIRSRGWAIVYPYVLWSVLFWASMAAARLLVHVNGDLPFDALLHIAIRPISIFWFLYALLLMQLAALLFAGRATVAAGVTALALLAFTFLSNAPPTDVVPQTIVHAPYFVAGLWLAQHGRKLMHAIRSPLGIAAAAVLFVGGALALWRLGDIVPVSLWTIPVSVLGLALMMTLAVALARTRRAGRHLAWLGMVSLPIYLMHIIVLPIAPRLLSALHLRSVPLDLAFGTAFGLYVPVVAFVLAERLGVADWLALTGKSPFKRHRPAPSPINPSPIK